MGTKQVRGGILLGDIITGVNGKKTSDYNELRDELERYEVGETVSLDIIRNDQVTGIQVVLEAVD